MFNKVMIANRGEIAVRIIRACRELNIRTVVVYSTADTDSMAVKLADEAICIGAPSPSESYLLIERLLTAADLCEVDAIHPGYGFLSENPYFAVYNAALGKIFTDGNGVNIVQTVILRFGIELIIFDKLCDTPLYLCPGQYRRLRIANRDL